MADKKEEYGEVSGGTGGYESMVWVRDKDGKEYACYLKDIKGIKAKEQLTEEEKAVVGVVGVSSTSTCCGFLASNA